MGIFLELSASNMHLQNIEAERFKQFIIEKAYAIRLSTNLLYKPQRKIVTTAIYLYNQTL